MEMQKLHLELHQSTSKLAAAQPFLEGEGVKCVALNTDRLVIGHEKDHGKNE